MEVVKERENKNKQQAPASIAYSKIAGNTLAQFAPGGTIDFRQLLSIPLEDRIPSMAGEFGIKKMHRLVNSILMEFCLSLPIPKSKKLTNTGKSFCTCDILLYAFEDQLAIEDLVVFFETAKKGQYGSFDKLLTHYGIIEKLSKYREQRNETYYAIKDAEEKARKEMAALPRIGKVKAIGEILNETPVIHMNKRRNG